MPSRANTNKESYPLPQRFIDEASRSGSEEKVHQGFARKLHRLATDNPVVNLAREAYRAMTDPRLPTKYKVIVIAGLLYFIAPIDAVPDVIPGLGFVDDLVVLSAIVASVHQILKNARDDAKAVIRDAEEAAERVVDHTLSEARETWARRGVAQFALCLWGSTTAAAVGLIYYVTRLVILDSIGPAGGEPFLWGVGGAAAVGFIYNVMFLRRVWGKYTGLPPNVREPLAYAVVSLMDWRQVLILSLPILALVALIGLRIGLSF